MRLTYILAVVVAATLHASGTALAATKDSNHAAISNVAAVDTTQENGGRMLRKVEEDELEEERGGFGKINSWLKQKGVNEWFKQQGVMAKHQAKAHFNPRSQEWRLRKELNRANRNQRHNEAFKDRLSVGFN